MTSLSHQKEKLARQKARLQQQEQKLKEQERKKRTRRLIELGGLVVKAGLEELNNNTHLGALLSLKEDTKNEQRLTQWTQVGAQEFEATQTNSSDTLPLLITFETEPHRELKSRLRDLNFKWNPFRKEWYGYGNKQKIQEIVHPMKGHVEMCEN